MLETGGVYNHQSSLVLRDMTLLLLPGIVRGWDPLSIQLVRYYFICG